MGPASEFRISDGDGASVVGVTGEIDILTAPQLRETLLGHLTSAAPNLAVDLSGVTFIDSTGLSVLVNALRRARSLGGDVRLLLPSEQVTKVLELTRLTDLFVIEAAVEGDGVAAS